jgi:hypothetical protein
MAHVLQLCAKRLERAMGADLMPAKEYAGAPFVASGMPFSKS